MATVYEKHGRIERFFSSQDPVARAVRRPWTPIADFLTGVVERKERSTYDSALLREWVKGLKSAQFNNAVEGTMGYTGRTYRIEGTENEIVDTINSRLASGPSRLDEVKGAEYGMQSLRRRDGSIRITVNGDTLDSSIISFGY